jgi:hypothetical protein
MINNSIFRNEEATNGLNKITNLKLFQNIQDLKILGGAIQDDNPNYTADNVNNVSRTPESVFSTGSEYNYNNFKGTYSLPIAELQIVKPIDGSQTLLHWQQLGKPNLGCLFENRPGISLKQDILYNDVKLKIKTDNLKSENFIYDQICSRQNMFDIEEDFYDRGYFELNNFEKSCGKRMFD